MTALVGMDVPWMDGSVTPSQLEVALWFLWRRMVGGTDLGPDVWFAVEVSS